MCFSNVTILARTDLKCENTEVYSEPCQISKMERFVKIVICVQFLTIFAKRYNWDVWKSFEYASVMCDGRKEFFLITIALETSKTTLETGKTKKLNTPKKA